MDLDAGIRWREVNECDRCGALTVDASKHAAFHDSVTETSEQAEHASSEAGEALDRIGALEQR